MLNQFFLRCLVANATAFACELSENLDRAQDNLGSKPPIFRERTMWGKHLIIDMSAGDKERVRSAKHISRFVETLVETIGMKPYGPPVLQHFAEHLPDAAGYSLVQLIETSAITGHFCDRSGDAYIDIFSCLDFQAELAVDVVRAAFRPQHINFMTLARQASQPRASYMLAAE
jgi:S-adenosylmethionine decarboxylase